ncbi:MAG: methyltransferase domain-containing protein [Pseudomonadota bacterium]
MDLKEEAAISGDPSHHWYYISKGRAIKSLLDGQRADAMLDVGAGSGVFSRMLLQEGVCNRATCVDPNYSNAWLEQTNDVPIGFTRSVGAVDASLVLMIDVVEHVDDDKGLIREYAKKADIGTRFLISAPAFQFLWSSHDTFLEHRRRYTEGDLEATVRAAGLQPLKSRYFFGLLFPAAVALRAMDRALKGKGEASRSALKTAPDWLNKTLVAIHDVERIALLPFNRIAGVTVFCLAEKRTDGIFD